jgi:hypothetical protein
MVENSTTAVIGTVEVNLKNRNSPTKRIAPVIQRPNGNDGTSNKR